MEEKPETLNVNLNVNVYLHSPGETEILKQLGALREKAEQIMAGIQEVTAAELQESTDLKTLHTLVGQILTAVVNGNLSSAQAQALIDQMNGDDTTVKADIAAISAAVAPPAVTIPDVTGKTQADATAALTAAGLTVGTVTSQTGSTVPVGSVVSQSPSAGASVPPGAAVALVVSA